MKIDYQLSIFSMVLTSIVFFFFKVRIASMNHSTNLEAILICKRI